MSNSQNQCEGLKYLKPKQNNRDKIIESIKSKFNWLSQKLNPKPHHLPISKDLFPLEKTHFQIKNLKNVKKIRKIINNTNKKYVTLKFDRMKYRYNGLYKDNFDEISFIIYFWKDENQYIIEFQRRDGCAFKWRDIYLDLIISIKKYTL